MDAIACLLYLSRQHEITLFIGEDGKNGADSRLSLQVHFEAKHSPQEVETLKKKLYTLNNFMQKKSLAMVRILIFERFVAWRHGFETKISQALSAEVKKDMYSMWLQTCQRRLDLSFVVLLKRSGTRSVDDLTTYYVEEVVLWCPRLIGGLGTLDGFGVVLVSFGSRKVIDDNRFSGSVQLKLEMDKKRCQSRLTFSVEGGGWIVCLPSLKNPKSKE
ncbi:hypothetical protein Tco_0583111 [Tanacetum coccineum]